MSTLATVELSSDDEDDLDFTLPQAKAGPSRKRRRSASGSSSGSSSDDARGEAVEAEEAKRLKADQAAAEAAERRARAAAAFEAMKGGGTDRLPTPNTDNKSEDTVEIQRVRRFAGDVLYETVKLPANDPEVIAFKRRQDAVFSSTDNPQSPTVEPGVASTDSPVVEPIKLKGKPLAKRKPRQSLEAMSAALDKGKKMTTLEKSQMDWKKHTGGDKAVHDELEANRRTGGYLQKRDFLDRVGERRMETFEDTRKRQR